MRQTIKTKTLQPILKPVVMTVSGLVAALGLGAIGFFGTQYLGPKKMVIGRSKK